MFGLGRRNRLNRLGNESISRTILYVFGLSCCGHTIAQSHFIFQTIKLCRMLYALNNKLNFKYNGPSLQRVKSKIRETF